MQLVKGGHSTTNHVLLTVTSYIIGKDPGRVIIKMNMLELQTILFLTILKYSNLVILKEETKLSKLKFSSDE